MLYQLFWLFLAFSFLGWCLEVAATAVRLGQYRDRGVLHGPLCLVYGITGCLITIALRELSGGWFFLFLFSALYATVVEWIAGHLLEHYSHTRWWDYSDCKWNLDGYICLSASVVWGALGLVTVKWLVPLLMRLYQLVPAGLAHVLLWIFAILLVIDLLGTALTLGGLRYKLPRVDEVNNRLANLTLRMGLWIFDRTEHAHQSPAAGPDTPQAHQKHGVCCRVQLLQNLFAVCNRRVPGRHHRNDFLPHYRWVLDEPFQPGVGTFLYCLGPCHCAGHPGFVQVQRPFGILAVRHGHPVGRCLRVSVQRIYRNRVRCGILGLQCPAV